MAPFLHRGIQEFLEGFRSLRVQLAFVALFRMLVPVRTTPHEMLLPRPLTSLTIKNPPVYISTANIKYVFTENRALPDWKIAHAVAGTMALDI